jgi:hypothetical protein
MPVNKDTDPHKMSTTFDMTCLMETIEEKPETEIRQRYEDDDDIYSCNGCYFKSESIDHFIQQGEDIYYCENCADKNYYCSGCEFKSEKFDDFVHGVGDTLYCATCEAAARPCISHCYCHFNNDDYEDDVETASQEEERRQEMAEEAERQAEAEQQAETQFENEARNRYELKMVLTDLRKDLTHLKNWIRWNKDGVFTDAIMNECISKGIPASVFYEIRDMLDPARPPRMFACAKTIIYAYACIVTGLSPAQMAAAENSADPLTKTYFHQRCSWEVNYLLRQIQSAYARA